MSEDLAFSRFESMNACSLEMKKLGHSAEDCNKICEQIRERAMKGALLKASPIVLEVLTKADETRIVLGGNAQWEIEDDDGDILTTEAQVKALTRFFNQKPEYQLITLDHAKGPLVEVKAAQPQLKFTTKAGVEQFTHVHEAGTYFISEIRPDDGSKTTEWIRAEAKAGHFNGYSVNVIPLERDPTNSHRILDAEYTAITLTTKGRMLPRNPRTRNVEVLSKAAKCDCDTEVCGGACCTFVSQYYPETVDKTYFEAHGLETKAAEKGFYVKYPAVCKSFDQETKRCGSWLNRPESCRVYPQRESPFIAKAKCSLLKGLEAAKTKAQTEEKTPTLNTVKSDEAIFAEHGFNKTVKH